MGTLPSKRTISAVQGKAALGLLAWAALLSGVALLPQSAPQAQTSPAPQYCYQSSPQQCFASQAEAEAALRAQPLENVPSHLWKRTDTLPLAGSDTAQTMYYIEPDALGTPRVVLDPATNRAVWRWDLTGDSVLNQDPDGDGQAFVFDMRFPGQRYDAATGMSYNYFRDYDPVSGRFIESDPLGLEAGPTTYGYGNLSPLAHADEDGLIAGRILVGFAKRARLGKGAIRKTNKAVLRAKLEAVKRQRLAKKAQSQSQGQASQNGHSGCKPTGSPQASPRIDPRDIINKTPDEIEQVAVDNGLIPKGPDPKGGRGAYLDPITGQQRILCHTNCANPHGHVNNPQGLRLDASGNVVPAESPAAHLSIKLP